MPRPALLSLLLCLAIISPGEETRSNVNDFAAYWTAGRQVLEGGDPYAAGPVLAREQRIGFSQPVPLIMRNPPWVLPLVVPFALFPFSVAQKLWLVAGLVAILLAARWLWELYHFEGQSHWSAWLVTALFLPVAVVLAIGQIGPFVLLGMAGFLRFEKKQKLILSGLFLFLVALKPHLIFLLWIALLLWSTGMRVGRLLGALLSVTLVASFVAIALDHLIFAQYFHLLTGGEVLTELTPTVSGSLRLSLGHYSLQFLPAFLAVLWLLFYWSRSREQWRWTEQVPVLLLVSLLTTSYGWFFDQVVLLPCVFQATAWVARRGGLTLLLMSALYLATNGIVLTLILRHYTTFSYAWTVPAWCLLYALAWSTSRSHSPT